MSENLTSPYPRTYHSDRMSDQAQTHDALQGAQNELGCVPYRRHLQAHRRASQRILASEKGNELRGKPEEVPYRAQTGTEDRRGGQDRRQTPWCCNPVPPTGIYPRRKGQRRG